ncbi:MAG TPA: amino acid permease [Parafilimonas sp.]|nr:amino acid permease [Parafilimonas sp.]
MSEIENIQDDITTRNIVVNSNESNGTKVPLKRVLGLTSAILLVAGNVIGTGIFKKIVPMAASGLSEKYILAAWILAGIITMLGAFSIAGLAKLTTEAGGMFEYLRLCYGDFISFLFGWSRFTIVGSGAIAAVAFIFAQSFNSFIHFPDLLYQWQHVSVGSVYPFADSGVKTLAIIVIVLLTWFNYRGIKNTAVLNNVVTGAKIFGILLLIVLGVFFSHSSEVVNTNSFNMNNAGWLSFAGIFFGVMLNAFWAYDGFANVSAVSGEIKNPKKNLPVAIITGVSIVLILYTLINYAFMHSMSLNQLASIGGGKVAAIVVAENIIGKAGTVMISLLVLLSTFGFLNAAILVNSRFNFRMAQANLFFKNASRVHPVYQTPHIALLYFMIGSCVLVVSGSFDVLTDMVVFASFSFYVLLAIGLIKMKRKGVIREKITGYPFAPIVFSLFIVIVLVSTFINNPSRSITGIALVLTGVPFYYFFKRKNKKVSEQHKLETTK